MNAKASFKGFKGSDHFDPKPLKAYGIYGFYKDVHLTTHPGEIWNLDGKSFNKGYVITDAGWIVVPSTFRKYHPKFCIFSRMEYRFFDQIPLVKAWLYTPETRALFRRRVDRDALCCFVNPACLYEL